LERLQNMVNLLNRYQFIDRYYDHLPRCSTGRAAYDATEGECMAQHGARKYASYNSFRVQLFRWHEKRKRARR
jgi:hypothetical protein